MKLTLDGARPNVMVCMQLCPRKLLVMALIRFTFVIGVLASVPVASLASVIDQFDISNPTVGFVDPSMPGGGLVHFGVGDFNATRFGSISHISGDGTDFVTDDHPPGSPTSFGLNLMPRTGSSFFEHSISYLNFGGANGGTADFALAGREIFIGFHFIEQNFVWKEPYTQFIFLDAGNSQIATLDIGNILNQVFGSDLQNSSLNDVGVSVGFDLFSNIESVDLSQVPRLRFDIGNDTSSPGTDIAIDIIQIVPEPRHVALALLSVTLLFAGFLHRRHCQTGC